MRLAFVATCLSLCDVGRYVGATVTIWAWWKLPEFPVWLCEELTSPTDEA